MSHQGPIMLDPDGACRLNVGQLIDFTFINNGIALVSIRHPPPAQQVLWEGREDTSGEG